MPSRKLKKARSSQTRTGRRRSLWPVPKRSAKRIVAHVFTVAVVCAAVLGIPFSQSTSFAALASGSDPDAISSATVVLDQPSGTYFVFINAARRPDEESLEFWEDFFSGEEVGITFEDISCSVARGDSGGLSMAQSYQSQLPENQMKLRQDDPTLMLSKAEHGHFDFIVMSSEAVDAYAASSLEKCDGVVTLEVAGAGADDTSDLSGGGDAQ